MHHASPAPRTDAPESSAANPEPLESKAVDRERAAQVPTRQSVSAADTAANQTAAVSAEAQGRKTLTTAFVRLGAGEHLTVELRDGRTVILRDVVMHAGKYCGAHVVDGAAGSPFCGKYADVVAARSGSAPISGSALSSAGPIESGRDASERR